MSVERVYWRVGQSSEMAQAIEQVIARKQQFSAAMKALQEEFGGVVWLYGHSDFCGMQFAGDIPDGWRKSAKGYAKPDGRTKLGRTIRSRIEAVTGVDGFRLGNMLGKACGGELNYWADGHVYFPTLERIGGYWVVGVPAPLEKEILGCEKLKMSEYWKLREAEAERNG